MGNLQFGDKQNINQEVTLEIQNIVDNTVIIENINEAIAEQVSIQDKLITIDGYDCTQGGEINFEQDITAQVASKLITNNITDAIAASDMMNRLDASASGGLSSINKGIADVVRSIGDAVSSIMDSFTGPMKYAIIACIVCCCLLVLVMIVMGLSPAGQKATGNLGSAAARRF